MSSFSGGSIFTTYVHELHWLVPHVINLLCAKLSFYGAILFRIGKLFGSISYRLYSSVVSYSTVMLTICYKTVNENNY